MGKQERRPTVLHSTMRYGVRRSHGKDNFGLLEWAIRLIHNRIGTVIGTWASQKCPLSACQTFFLASGKLWSKGNSNPVPQQVFLDMLDFLPFHKCSISLSSIYLHQGGASMQKPLKMCISYFQQDNRCFIGGEICLFWRRSSTHYFDFSNYSVLPDRIER